MLAHQLCGCSTSCLTKCSLSLSLYFFPSFPTPEQRMAAHQGKRSRARPGAAAEAGRARPRVRLRSAATRLPVCCPAARPLCTGPGYWCSSSSLSARLGRKKRGTSAVDLAGSSAAAALIMIASFWAAQKADRHNIPFKRFLSVLTGQLFNPLW